MREQLILSWPPRDCLLFDFILRSTINHARRLLGSSNHWEDREYPDIEDDEEMTIPCPKCGAELFDDDQCPSCGWYLIHDTRAWSGKSIWWIALGLLGIIAVAFGTGVRVRPPVKQISAGGIIRHMAKRRQSIFPQSTPSPPHSSFTIRN